MSLQSPDFSIKGDIHANASVTGNIVVIGHGNQVNQIYLQVRGAKDATFQVDQRDPLLQQLLQALADGSAQATILTANGMNPAIAAPCWRAEDLVPDAPFRSPLGIPAPFSGQPDQLARNFSSLDDFLRQLDQQFGGTLYSVSDGQQSLNLADLLLQKGNLALWRFRQGALRLFAEQASLYALAETQDSTQPALLTFQAAARTNLDVLRGWVLFQKYRTGQPVLIDQTSFSALSQGHWQVALDRWSAERRLTPEQAQTERSYLNAIGEHYDPQVVQAAASDAERYFTEALRRQPEQSAALVNLAALLAESALLTYIETGTADRPRLQHARNLFQQAHTMLEQRPDRDGQVAFAQCLLYEAVSLPPDARLEMVQWAAGRVQQLRASLEPHTATAVRWDIAQLNLARRDPGFFNWKKVEQARDILVSMGAMAVLVNLAEQWLSAHAHTASSPQAGMHAGAPHHSMPAHPLHSGGNVSGSAGAPSGVHAGPSHAWPHVPAHGLVGHGVTKTASATPHGLMHVLHHMLSTIAGKVVAVAVVTTIVGASVAGVVLTHRASAATYSTTRPGLICDTSGGVWKPQNLDGVSCPPSTTGTQLVINNSGSRGYLYLQQLPHNQTFSSSNTISTTAVLGGTASGYQTKCIGLAEKDANTGYSVEYCNTGAWFIASISSGGTILHKLDHGVVTTLTTATISLTLNGTTLSFSIENNVVDTINISTLQPGEVGIVYDCVGYGAYQTIGGNYLLVQNFNYKTE